MSCPYCAGGCASGNTALAAQSDLLWFWSQLAGVADRRGDPDLISGAFTIEAPDDAAQRAAATGLVGARRLVAHQRRRVDLSKLAAALAHSCGPSVTPGVLAAHAVRRRLAAAAAARDLRAGDEAVLLTVLDGRQDADVLRVALRKSGWVTKLLGRTDGHEVLAAALRVTDAVGSKPFWDRRLLASEVAGDPHALDRKAPVGTLTLTLLEALGRVAAGGRTRDRWREVGVRLDEITGGLSVVGIVPTGWSVPNGVPVTLPPLVLTDCDWPSPRDGRNVVFVSENPSVLTAATSLAAATMVCLAGTPSDVEVEAIARLERSGWQLRVRADFDDAGINHVRSLLEATEDASPWRMAAVDYQAARSAGSVGPLRADRLADTPWDPELRRTMLLDGYAAYEEALLDELLNDVADSQRP